MNAPAPKQRRTAARLRLSALGAGLMLSLTFGQAQAIIFHDPGHMAGNLFEQITSTAKEIGQWVNQHTRDYTRWMQLVKEYQSTLNQVQNLSSMLTLPQGVPLEKIPDPDSYMVEETCGQQGGGGVSGLLGSLFGIDLRGDVFAQQYAICSTTQQMRNHKFNEMVEYLTTTTASIKEMDREWTSLQSRLTSGGDSGDVKGNIDNALEASRRLEQANNEFKQRMRAYDIYIKSQMKVQGNLAKMAMRGNAGLLRTVTDAAAMRLALCNSGRCNGGDD